MTLEVLQSEQQIKESRHTLRRRGLSSVHPGWRRWLARWWHRPGVTVGDHVKSWDVLKTAQFVEQHVPKDAPVLDIGAYASEIAPILCRLGYRRVSGLDLNPDLAKMPLTNRIDYRVGDFLHAPYADGAFAAITAISVIEHGFNGAALSTEVARLLRPGGFFVASFDFWPEKISTETQEIFGMSWTIFSSEEVEQFLGTAASHGLRPFGPLDFAAAGKPISCFDRDYTFAWIVLRRQ